MGQTETAQETLNDKIFDLSFSVHKSRRYHEKLRGFYEGWRDSMKIVTVIVGSGVFFLLTAGLETIAQLFSAFVALWAILDIVIAPDKKAERHKDICERFTLLAAELEKGDHDLGHYKTMASTRLEIEKSEPPCKRLVDLLARNDECRARGFPPEDLVPLSQAQRYLGYFFTFGMERLERWKADHQRKDASSAVG